MIPQGELQPARKATTVPLQTSRKRAALSTIYGRCSQKDVQGACRKCEKPCQKDIPRITAVQSHRERCPTWGRLGRLAYVTRRRRRVLEAGRHEHPRRFLRPNDPSSPRNGNRIRRFSDPGRGLHRRRRSFGSAPLIRYTCTSHRQRVGTTTTRAPSRPR